MSTARFNDSARMRGDARFLTVAMTKDLFDLRFSVWSKLNECAAADLAPEGSRHIYGVLYEVPDYLITREGARARMRKSMDQVEGNSYKRVSIDLLDSQGRSVRAQTYLVVSPQDNLLTSFDYTAHIISGIEEHAIPREYREYVIERIRQNYPAIADMYRTEA